jgi:hypothetical protein
MRGDGRTPRGLRAQQTTSHAAGGTPISVAPNHGTRANKKQKRPQAQANGGSLKRHPPPQTQSNKPNNFKRQSHYGRRIPHATSAAPTKKSSNTGRKRRKNRRTQRASVFRRTPSNHLKQLHHSYIKNSNRYPTSTQDETKTDRQRHSESYRVQRVVRTTTTKKESNNGE